MAYGVCVSKYARQHTAAQLHCHVQSWHLLLRLIGWCCRCIQLLAQAAAIQQEAAQHIDRELALKLPR